MFVRASFAQAVDSTAILVPQAAVSRDPKGAASVFVLAADNSVIARPISTIRTQGADWVVTAGLAPGEKVIVQGTGTLKPGAKVQAFPQDSPQKIFASPAKAG